MTRRSLIHCPFCPNFGPLEDFTIDEPPVMDLEDALVAAFEEDTEGLCFCHECEREFNAEMATLVEDPSDA